MTTVTYTDIFYFYKNSHFTHSWRRISNIFGHARLVLPLYFSGIPKMLFKKIPS